MKKLWGGRFGRETGEEMEAFSASIGFDWRLWEVDIRGSIAYAKGLRRAGIITAEEEERLIAGLQEVAEEFRRGGFQPEPPDEDIHTAVERRLYRKIGRLAGKLHAGRSRNDQVATDVRLCTMSAVRSIDGLIGGLERALLEVAENNLSLIMPGYTHLQRAQPVLFSHYIMSWFWMLERDRERLHDLSGRVSILPLGAGALSGHALGIDRHFLAQELGFDSAAENSIDAVSDRDFVLEFLGAASILLVHLSRLAEDLIIWSSAEFGFVEIDEAFATGSSIMPQKKNPDSLELIRGKTGRVIGDLVSLLTVMKGLPSSYNRDLQEDKEPLFDAIDTLEAALIIMSGVVRTLEIRPERMRAALGDYMLATDLADYLFKKGIPFRESHQIVGEVVKHSLEEGIPLGDLPIEDFRRFSELFDEDVREVFDFRRSVERRDSYGGTSTRAVREQMERAKVLLRRREEKS